MKKELIRDIIQWDVRNWSTALAYWEKTIRWENIHSCLELGGREGGLSLWLALKDKHVICSDYSPFPPATEILHKKYGVENKIHYELIDASNIPYENKFDLIIFKSVLGGIGRNDDKEIQRKVLSEIHKALKPGGKLLFAENLGASALHKLFRKKYTNWKNYWRYISVEEMEEFLQPYSSFEMKTAGILGSFGRSENQKNILASIDKTILMHIFPSRWRYIVYGIAEK